MHSQQFNELTCSAWWAATISSKSDFGQVHLRALVEIRSSLSALVLLL